jgi:hypothetical protein
MLVVTVGFIFWLTSEEIENNFEVPIGFFRPPRRDTQLFDGLFSLDAAIEAGAESVGILDGGPIFLADKRRAADLDGVGIERGGDDTFCRIRFCLD